jgi:hypothetical protein
MSAASVVVENLENFRKHRSFLISRRTKYRRTFETEPGEYTLKKLRKLCKIGQDILVPGDSHATAYNVGMQRVYLHIESVMKMDSEKIDQMARGE